MTGDALPGSKLIIYVDHSDVVEGRREDLKGGIRRVVDAIRSREPQLIAYGFHLDEKTGRMAVTAVHPDSASLELHLEIGREEFRALADMITLRRIEVFGPISERARDLLEQKSTMLGGADITVIQRFAGFATVAEPGD